MGSFYRLGGVFLLLALMAGLKIWRQFNPIELTSSQVVAASFTADDCKNKTSRFFASLSSAKVRVCSSNN